MTVFRPGVAVNGEIGVLARVCDPPICLSYGILWFGSSPNYGVHGDLALLRHQVLHYVVFQLFDLFDGCDHCITVARQIKICQEPGPKEDRSCCRFDMWRGEIFRDSRWIYIEMTVGCKPSPVYEAADDGE
jgi:hypothetical protein